jgi:hypothetical protein
MAHVAAATPNLPFRNSNPVDWDLKLVLRGLILKKLGVLMFKKERSN